MDSQNKYYETGSNPYYLNLNNTAIEITNLQDSTNPEYGFMNHLNSHILIQNPTLIVDTSENG
ncbi:hypothetical protein D778_02389 [Xanthomarina gelatinilytica]|uniref:Uncharacterized protein n=1 Tax=Xanthomarina gelatinilytica TaxID=1137281 RepID=M7MKY4_9FLAO|nr:hypothetical protein D778_02389 [Xanthomarina gelatinilytica]